MNSQDKNNKIITKDHRILAKNTLFSFLFSYGKFLFALISSFIIARIISQETWGFLILTLSIINIFNFILLFFPPSLGISYYYYVPQYMVLNQYSKLKSFVLNSLIIRLIFLIPIFILTILFFSIFISFFEISLHNYTHLFYLLSPLIAINSFDKVFNDLSRSLNLFKVVFILLLIKYIVNIGGLIFLVLFVNIIQVEMVAAITLLASIVPFVLNVLVIFYVLKYKIKKTEEEEVTFKETFWLIYKYGSILSVTAFIDNFYNEFKIQSVGFSVDSRYVVGFNLAQHYREVSFEASRSLTQPLTISFSALYSTKQFDKIQKIFKVIFGYSLFLILLISGFLFFFVELFLSVIYGESFLGFSLIVKLMLISTVFILPASFFFSLLRVSDKLKYYIPVTLLFFLIRIPLFLLGLQYFGVEGGIIGLTIGEIIVFIIVIILIQKFFNIKLNFKKHIFPYFIFFISLGITLILENLFLSEFDSFILDSLNLHLIRHLNFSSIIVFVLVYLLLIIIFKVLTTNDIENIKVFFNKDTFIHKTMRKGLEMLKRIIWD